MWTGRQWLLWGGTTTSTSQSVAGDGAAYDPTTGTWARLPAAPLAPRENATGVWAGQKAIFWGGDDSSDLLHPHTFGDGAAYDPTSRTWTSLPSSPLTPRSGASAFWTGSNLVVFGGRLPNTDTVLLDGAMYNPSASDWTRLPALPTGPGGTPVWATVAWTGRALDVWVTFELVHHDSASSETIKPLYQAATWQPGWTSWHALEPLPPDISTYGATATWTGTQVVLTDGSFCLPDESCPFTHGVMSGYEPATGAWVALPANVVLDAHGPTVWTGSSLVVLNDGSRESEPAGPVLSPGDGSAYDPVAHTWTSLPGDPIGVLDGAGIAWTGKELLVWSPAASPGPNVGAALLLGVPHPTSVPSV